MKKLTELRYRRQRYTRKLYIYIIYFYSKWSSLLVFESIFQYSEIDVRRPANTATIRIWTYYWRRGNSAFQAVYGQNLEQLLAAWSKHLSAFLITVFGDIPVHCVFLKQNYLPSMKNLYFWRIRSNRQDYKSFFPFS